MGRILGVCGIVCSECGAYLATQADDLGAKQRVLAQWRVEYNAPNLDLSAVTCDGCTAVGGRQSTAHLPVCDTRKCVIEHAVPNCGHCPEYVCDNLDPWFQAVPGARQVLDEEHRRSDRAGS